MGQSLGTARRVAFFGGSFDPPHNGHLAVAKAARDALGLDLVLFAPVGAQPLKPQGSTASFDDRAAMTRLAIEGEPGLELSLIDAPKPQATPNYTIDTLLQLRSILPSGGTLFCLLGADSFFGLGGWHRGAEIPFIAQLIVAARPGQPLDDLVAALPHGVTLEVAPAASLASPGFVRRNDLFSYSLRNEAGDTATLHLLPDLHVDISASKIRESIWDLSSPAHAAHGTPQARRSILLPTAVLDYIRAHQLYRQPAGA